MFLNYFVTALRNILKNRLYSAINLGGLAIGLAACLLIFLFVRDEISYDTWIPDNERIFRLEQTLSYPGSAPVGVASTQGPTKPALEKDFPAEVESVVRLYNTVQPITVENRNFADEIFYVDEEFNEIFPLELVDGTLANMMKDRNSIVLSESVAIKYFGTPKAVGKRLTVDARDDLVVTGVYKDFPENTHFRPDMLTPIFDDHPVVSNFIRGWGGSNFYIYVKLRDAKDAKILEDGFAAFADRNVFFNISMMDGIAPSEVIKFHLRSLPSIHLRSNRQNDLTEGGDIMAVYTFSAVALLILLIACFNFMNLTTARSIQRAREVSLRKVVGAHRKQLIHQFLGETVLMIVFATALAVVLAQLVLPWYNNFLGKNLELSLGSDFGLIFTLLGLILFVGFFGGAYPAFILSSFKPAEILKSNKSSSERSPFFRNVLVFLQFSISIGLITSTAIVYGQTLFAKNLDLGYETERTLVISNISSEDVRPVTRSLKLEMSRIPGVESASYSLDAPPLRNANSTYVLPEGKSLDSALTIEYMIVDEAFFETYGIAPVAGRGFSKEFRTDFLRNLEEGEVPQHNTVITESAARALGFSTPADAVGKSYQAVMGSGEFNLSPKTIIGVIPDIKLRSVRFDAAPMIYFAREEGSWNFLTLRIRGDNISETLRQIDGVWNKLVPGIPIKRSFINEEFAVLYEQEGQRGDMLAGFSGFAILVACLGLYGLASFAAERRTKEIGIRKVLGATISDIVRLLTMQFSKPVILANLLAWPVAWYFMSDWLNNFVYRISMNPVYFVAAGLLALIIAWVTVSGHAIRVAKTNPIHALRYE